MTVPTPRPDASTPRLLATLGGAGAIAGLVIVGVYLWTAPTIEAYRAAQLRAAVREVLAQPARFDTLFLVAGALRREPPAHADGGETEQIYVGYDVDNRRIGFAIPAAAPGFQDVIHLIFGWDDATETLIGMTVLESRETPGLGDKIERDSAFVAAFHGVVAPPVGVKPGRGVGDPREIDLITGATISSRAVLRAIDDALTTWEPRVDRWLADGSP